MPTLKGMWYEQDAGKDVHINEWDARIKQAGLHVKWPEQIAHVHMLTKDKLENKLLKTEQDYINYPGYFQKLLVDQGMTPEEAEARVVKDAANASRRVKRAHNVLALCEREYAIRKTLQDRGEHPPTPDKYRFEAPALKMKIKAADMPVNAMRQPVGTTYYIDADSGDNGNDGLSAGQAWATAAQYTTTTVRTAGDIAICRRGTTALYWDGAGTLNHDEDGTFTDPLTVRGAYENEFSDDVDLSGTATATLTLGSKAVIFSADISGVLSAGEWIYEENDDQYDYAYLVVGVSGSDVTLAWPYLGENPGSGKTMVKMGEAAKFGTTSGTGSIFLSNDNFWRYQGILLSSNAGIGVFTNYAYGFGCKDIDFKGGSSGGTGMLNDASFTPLVSFEKIACHNSFIMGVSSQPSGSTEGFTASTVYCDMNNKNDLTDYSSIGIKDLEVVGQNTGQRSALFDATRRVIARRRNATYSNPVFVSRGENQVIIEDLNGDSGTNVVFSRVDVAGTTATPFVEKVTDIVRSGGAGYSLKVTPNAMLKVGRRIDAAAIINELALALPADSEKTITLHVKADDSDEWTANPEAAEISLQAEYYCNASNCYRKTVKSAQEPAFLTSEDWLPLSVTFTPARDGIVYVSLLYGKPLESGKTNVFYVDPKVEIS